MKITGITYSRYNYPLKSPFKTSREIITTREGFIIKFETDKGISTFGESAPLPAFGSEYIFDAEKSIKKGIDFFTGAEFPESIFSLQSIFDPLNLTPTVQFAFEQCFMELFIYHNSPQLTTINISDNINIPANGLLNITNPDESLFKTAELIQSGYETIKYKMGINDFADDLKILSAIRHKFPVLKIRLDINGAWNFKDAMKNLEKLSELNIEFIEQPVDNINDLNFVASTSPIPIAADESLRSFECAQELVNEGFVDYFILKPMLLGGFFKTKKIIDLCARNRVKCIISSTFETNIGRRMLVFTTSLAPQNYAHGLATTNFLTGDTTKDIFPLQNNLIHFSTKKYSNFLRIGEE